MAAKQTTAEFIARAAQVHGDRYDYSLVHYTGDIDKVRIICPVHGIFEQRPGNHKQGQGCCKCMRPEAARIRNRAAAASFVEKARKVHKGRFDYSHAQYKAVHVKVIIICPVHGAFSQTPGDHLTGKGCLECRSDKARAMNKVRSLAAAAAFVHKAEALHGKKYDYSQVAYVNNHTKVVIICPEHGPFSQVPSSHLLKYGCNACGRKITEDAKRLTTADFIRHAQEVHGTKYDYSLTTYTLDNEKVRIICPEHGPFEQLATSHKQGKGCAKCGEQRSAAAQRLTWVELAKGRPATLYALRMYKGDESFYKVGITYHSIKHRYRETAKRGGYEIEIVAKYTSTNAAAVYDWEQSIIETFAHLQYRPKSLIGGQSECFSSIDEILACFPL